MSTIKSSNEDITINADGSGRSVKFQANGVEKASIDSAGNFTSTSIDATKLSGTVPNFTSTGIDDNATSTAITIDASENVGIGVVPESWYSSHTALQVGGLATFTGDTSASAGSSTRVLNNSYLNSGGSWRYQITDEASFYGQYDGTHSFRVAPSGTADAAISWTTVAQFYKGSYNGVFETGAVSTTGATPGMKHDSTTGGPGGGILMSGTTTGFKYNMRFYNPNGQVGYIKTEGTSTSYITTSDYRLKENVVPMTGSIDRLKALKPSNFNFIADPDTTVDGFLAHEAQVVVPECVGGTKDAMMDEEYEVTPAVMDGETVVTKAVMGTRSVPDYQGIDQSKLVPLLVASLQEAIARIEQLENA